MAETRCAPEAVLPATRPTLARCLPGVSGACSRNRASRSRASRNPASHGWTQVILPGVSGACSRNREVFHTGIPTSGPLFDDLCRIAAQVR